MEYKRLEEVCTLITDGTHQTPTYTDTGYIFLSSKNVTSGKIDWENVKYVSKELHEELSKRVIPKKNDILLAKNGRKMCVNCARWGTFRKHKSTQRDKKRNNRKPETRSDNINAEWSI